MDYNNYCIVMGQHKWCEDVFHTHLKELKGNWLYCDSLSCLETMAAFRSPKYIFFLHWSDIVPEEITDAYECICFHPTKLPFGRGGTPLQNLILDGIKHTHITSFRMTSEVDAGPIYLQTPVYIGEGTALELYRMFMAVAAEQIRIIIASDITPEPQIGTPTYYSRREPYESEIDFKLLKGVSEVHYFIRMLDAPGYPLAYLLGDKFKIEFHSSEVKGKELHAKVIIKENV